jgi:hypothetical protein
VDGDGVIVVVLVVCMCVVCGGKGVWGGASLRKGFSLVAIALDQNGVT